MRASTAAVRSAVQSEIVRLAFLFELEFDEGFLRFWTGIGPIEWDGKTWTGAGTLIKLSLPEETRDMEAKNCILELSATPDIVDIAQANEDGWQGRPARVWLATLRNWTTPTTRFLIDAGGVQLLDINDQPLEDTSDIELHSEIIAHPMRWFKGTMDQMPIKYDPKNPIIRLFVESDGLLFNLSKERRLTHEDQQIDYAGDRFFEHVADLQDKEIILE